LRDRAHLLGDRDIDSNVYGIRTCYRWRRCWRRRRSGWRTGCLRWSWWLASPLRKDRTR